MSNFREPTSFQVMKSSQQNKKRVSFSAEPPQEIEFSMDGDKEAIWWQPNDFDAFRASIKEVIKDTKKTQSVFVGISGVHKFAEMAAANVSDEDKLLKALHKVKVDPLLTLWCTSGIGRGLESLLRRKFTKRTSSSARSSYMALVLDWQGAVSDEDLRNKCLSFSRQDRILARMMGEADAIAELEARKAEKLSVEKSKIASSGRLLGRLQSPVTKRIWIPQSA